jgi:hypothetical protein
VVDIRSRGRQAPSDETVEEAAIEVERKEEIEAQIMAGTDMAPLDGLLPIGVSFRQTVPQALPLH